MDGKNVLMAIALSTLVLVFWATFFEPPPVKKQIAENQISKREEASSPSIEKVELSKKIVVLAGLKPIARTNSKEIKNTNIQIILFFIILLR